MNIKECDTSLSSATGVQPTLMNKSGRICNINAKEFYIYNHIPPREHSFDKNLRN